MSDEHKVRRVTSRGTLSYQYGHYAMQGERGERCSVFKVDVHLGEQATPDEALVAWPEEISRLRQVGRTRRRSCRASWTSCVSRRPFDDHRTLVAAP